MEIAIALNVWLVIMGLMFVIGLLFTVASCYEKDLKNSILFDEFGLYCFRWCLIWPVVLIITMIKAWMKKESNNEQ
jgi:hypothetical protein